MSLMLSPALVFNAASGVLLLALGLFVAALRPRKRVNAVFAVFSASFGLGFVPLYLLSADDPLYHAAVVAVAASLLVAALSLVLLAFLFPRPLAARERRLVRPAAFAAAAFGAVAVGGFLVPAGQASLAAVIPEGDLPYTTLFVTSFSLFTAAFVFALVLLALRFGAEAQGAPERAQRQFALVSAALLLYPAYNSGVESLDRVPGNAVLGLAGLATAVLLAALWLRNTARSGAPDAPIGRNVALLALAVPLLGLLAEAVPLTGWGGSGTVRVLTVAVLGYAILRHQVLDLELRLKWTVQRGTVASLFVALYVVVSQGTQSVLAPSLGPVLGIGAAGLLALATMPLHRAAVRLSDRVLPDTTASPEYLSEQKLRVYRMSLEQAMSPDGRVPAREGAALASLRVQLGLTLRDHALLEHAVRAQQGPEAAGALVEGVLVGARYRVVREVGRGASGEVYLARDERMDRDVALKRLAGAQRRDATALERFRREARLASALHHPGIVEVLDVAPAGREMFLVMEYMPGGTLEQRLGAGPLPEQQAVSIARDVLGALAALHAAGILHRDVKPSNILFDARGGAKLGDFTVAREMVSGETVGLTRTGGVVGTPGFMSPEQARGLPATARSDVYSAAATLFAAIAGRPPIQVEGLSEFDARLRVAQEVPDLPLAQASAGLNRALARALAKDPDQRFASAAEMARALR